MYKNTYTPSWSQNGKTIAFAHEYKDAQSDGSESYFREIYTINADGISYTRVTKNESFSSNPVWTANGIIYGLSSTTQSSNKDKGIYKVSTDGTTNTKLYSGDLPNYIPVSISPDGKKLAFYTSSPVQNSWPSNSDVRKLNILNNTAFNEKLNSYFISA